MTTPSQIMDAIYRRRAVRAFLPAPVSRETLNLLVDAAIQAPSAINLQPWRFAIAHRRETVRHIAEAAKAHLLTLMHAGSPFLRFCEMLENPHFDIFYDAPALVVICATSEAQQAAEDCAMAAQNLMLAAHASGLGTCCIGLARPWLSQPDTRRLLGIPDECVPVIPIIAGQPAAIPAPTGRRAPVIHWLDGET